MSSHCLVIVMIFEAVILVGASVDIQIKYKVCYNRITPMWKRESEKTAKSMKMCGILCSRLAWCRAITVCPAATGGYNCQFHYGIYYATCESFRRDLNCKIMIETTKNTAPISAEGCENGGTWNGTKCQCLEGFASANCERYIKDCGEGKALGYQNHPGLWDYVFSMTWPTGAPYPFETLCNFLKGKAVMFFRKVNVTMNWNRTWEEYKYMFTTTNEAFWMGLENTHYLTSSDQYQMQIYFTKFDGSYGQMFYKNFQLGPESTGYDLNYGSILVERDTGMSNGESDSNTFGPITLSRPFCTWDKPGCNSALQNGGWWHDAFATQYSLTKPIQPVTLYYLSNAVQAKSVSFQIFANHL